MGPLSYALSLGSNESICMYRSLMLAANFFNWLVRVADAMAAEISLLAVKADTAAYESEAKAVAALEAAIDAELDAAHEALYRASRALTRAEGKHSDAIDALEKAHPDFAGVHHDPKE